MSRKREKSERTMILPAEELIHRGHKKMEKVKITLIDYDETHFEQRQVEHIEDCFPFKDTPTVSWINIDGLHEVDVIEKVGKHFGVHHLLLEDILHPVQRPKMEDFGSYIFIVLKMIYFEKNLNEIITEQVSFIVGKNFVISFQEREGDVFDGVRERIRSGKGRIRGMGPDYLVYALIDAIVDNYFSVLETIGERMEVLEEELVTNPGPENLEIIHAMKRDIIYLRKSIWPVRELVNCIQHSESKLIDRSTEIYFRDLYDHTFQIMDTMETFREMIATMHDTYLSSISYRLNDVMKVLTIFASIFIPLTFLVGVYGMHFKYMLELYWEYSYYVLWAFMILISVLMLVYFKRKHWF